MVSVDVRVDHHVRHQDCDCAKFVESVGAPVPLGTGNLTAAEVTRLTGLSVHALSHWRQSVAMLLRWRQ